MKRIALVEWLSQHGNPHTETRYAGQPWECIAVLTQGMSAGQRCGLWNLSDMYVSEACGPFVELMPRKPLAIVS